MANAKKNKKPKTVSNKGTKVEKAIQEELSNFLKQLGVGTVKAKDNLHEAMVAVRLPKIYDPDNPIDGQPSWRLLLQSRYTEKMKFAGVRFSAHFEQVQKRLLNSVNEYNASVSVLNEVYQGLSGELSAVKQKRLANLMMEVVDSKVGV